MCPRLRLLTASYMPPNRNHGLKRFRGSKLYFSCSWQSGTVVAVDQGVERCLHTSLHTALFRRNTELCEQYVTGVNGNKGPISGRSNYVTNEFLCLARPTQATACWVACWSPLCMAVKLDISLLLEAVGAERYTEKLADNGVVTVEQYATLTEERLEEWGIPIYVSESIGKAKALLSSRDDVVQQELLVSGTNLG